MTCRAGHTEPCGCPDAIWQGVVIIDDRSEPGSWAQHIRDTECMHHAISPDSNRRHEGEGA